MNKEDNRPGKGAKTGSKPTLLMVLILFIDCGCKPHTTILNHIRSVA